MPDVPQLLDSRILVVDDVPADARFVESILRAAGYTRIDVLTDSTQAAELHRRQRFDLLILDLLMPGKNGYAVMAELEWESGGTRPQVLVMTSDPGELQRALLAGARDFVAKPVRSVELRARVRNLLEIRVAMKALERRGLELEEALGERTASLAEAERRFRAVVEQSIAGIYIVENGAWSYVNPRMCEILGYAPEDLIGRQTIDFVVEADRATVHAHRNLAFSGHKSSFSATVRLRCKEGNLVHLSLDAKYIAEGDRQTFLGVAQDVTEHLRSQEMLLEAQEQRERAVEQLRESEEKYRTLWEASSDVVVLMSRDGRILYANPSMARVFGYQPAEIEGRDIAVLQPERLQDAHRRGLKRYLATGQRRVDWRATEIVGLHRDGHEFPAEIGFSQLNLGGSAVFAAFIRDITERKRAQAALESANRRLQVLSDRVLAVQEEERRYISSELHDDVGQSLLALQLGMHRLGDNPGADSAQLHEECAGIVAGVQEKLRQLSIRLHPPQLAQLGLQEAVCALVSRQRATTGLDIRCACEGPEPGLLTAELETAAYRICQEALSNATRHSGAQRVEIRTKLEADRFCLSVSDDGRGFDAAIRGETASEAGHMGLISMEERARLAGGSLEVVTAPGAGTVVIAMFPRPDVQRAAAVAPSP
jgi:PAS domain S-box-containing protein